MCRTIIENMSSDNLQMHQINSSVESPLANSTNSNSSTSMQKSANIQFVSDSPITDPGQTSKVSEYARVTCACDCVTCLRPSFTAF